jgi:hypothetical protein
MTRILRIDTPHHTENVRRGAGFRSEAGKKTLAFASDRSGVWSRWPPIVEISLLVHREAGDVAGQFAVRIEQGRQRRSASSHLTIDNGRDHVQ